MNGGEPDDARGVETGRQRGAGRSAARRRGLGLVAAGGAAALLVGCNPSPAQRMGDAVTQANGSQANGSGPSAVGAGDAEAQVAQALSCTLEGEQVPTVPDAETACRIIAAAMGAGGEAASVPTRIALRVAGTHSVTADVTLADGRALPQIIQRSMDRPLGADDFMQLGRVIGDTLRSAMSG